MRTTKGLLISLLFLGFGFPSVRAADDSIATGGGASSAASVGAGSSMAPDHTTTGSGAAAGGPGGVGGIGSEVQAPAVHTPDTGMAPSGEKKMEEKKEGDKAMTDGQEVPKKKKRRKHRRKHDGDSAASMTPCCPPGLDQQNAYRRLQGDCRSPNGSTCTIPAPCGDVSASAEGGCSTGSCPIN